MGWWGGWGSVVVVGHAGVAFVYNLGGLCQEPVAIFEDSEGVSCGLAILTCHHFVTYFLVGIC
jgi:hypothetical protein